MALSANTKRDKRDNEVFPTVIEPGVKTSTHIYIGSMVAIDTTTGYLVKGGNAVTDRVLGCAEQEVNNTGSSGTLTCLVRSGVFKYANSASTDEITITEMFTVCYAVDDTTVAKTSGTGSRAPAGVVFGFDSTGVWVFQSPVIGACL